MKKVLSLALVLMMLLGISALTACGNDTVSTASGAASDVIGTWKLAGAHAGDVDITTDMLANNVFYDSVLEFKEGNILTITIKGESLDINYEIDDDGNISLENPEDYIFSLKLDGSKLTMVVSGIELYFTKQ